MPLIVGSGSTAPAESGGSVPRDLVTLGDIVLGGTDAFGVQWLLETFEGWTDAPAAVGDAVQRASGHGAWIDEAFYAPRMLTLEGHAFAGSWYGAESAANRLLAAIPLSTLSLLQVDTASPRQVMVRQEGQPLVQVVDDWARFSFSLLAPDPRRYSVIQTSAETALPSTTGGLAAPFSLPTTIAAVTTSGLLVLSNDGTMATPPTLTVTGPCPPFAITHRTSGRTLRFHESLAAGRSLVLDVANKRALLDGSAARRVTGSWFEYSPGSNEVAFSATSYDPDARLLSEHRDAWR